MVKDLRCDPARAAADGTVPQHWTGYTTVEHDIWRTLYSQQLQLVARHGAPEVLAGLQVLGASAQAIPDFAVVSERLLPATGWRIVAVPGLIPDLQFYALLAQRAFPVTVWIRGPTQLDYLQEPDLFHDFFGHVPLLVHPVFARFMQAYGAAGPKAIAHDAVRLLARVYWYTVEFGLINTPAGLKAFGSGILSSRGETLYSVTDPRPRRLPFNLERIMRTDYRIDAFQQTYFVLDSFEQLFHAAYDTDFGPLYERVKLLPEFAPDGT
jgi:phenylalanine-4-hydroxylase